MSGVGGWGYGCVTHPHPPPPDAHWENGGVKFITLLSHMVPGKMRDGLARFLKHQLPHHKFERVFFWGVAKYAQRKNLRFPIAWALCCTSRVAGGQRVRTSGPGNISSQTQ